MLTDYLPAPVRRVIYSALLTANAVEGVLDAAGEGLVPTKWQGIALGIATVLGLGLALKNTTDITVVADEG